MPLPLPLPLHSCLIRHEEVELWAEQSGVDNFHRCSKEERSTGSTAKSVLRRHSFHMRHSRSHTPAAMQRQRQPRPPFGDVVKKEADIDRKHWMKREQQQPTQPQPQPEPQPQAQPERAPQLLLMPPPLDVLLHALVVGASIMALAWALL